jgi:hypothetical protein
LPTAVQGAIEQGLQQGSGACEVFFRADDIAVPGRRFHELMHVFEYHRMPLALALVPAWLTQARWQVVAEWDRRNPALWCWHQHGWRHCNHAREGKKNEFDQHRPPEAVENDLRKGYQRLTQLLGNRFAPVFTPPWNRCSVTTLDMLAPIGFKAVSRSTGTRPPTAASMPDWAVGVDLHTRKEADAGQSMQRLCDEIERHIATGRCGVMIHHQRMNQAALSFLDALLGLIRQHPRLHPVPIAAS